MALRLGFLASHGGSGMRAILAAARDGRLPAEGRVLVTNNPDADARAVAAGFGVPDVVLNATTAGGADRLDSAIADTLARHGAEIVVLSGYMRRLGPATLARFHNRIINVHPGPLPAFGGRGMYGDRVHEAVLAAGAPASAATVHLVDAEYDHGPALARRAVPVEPGDTVPILRARVQAAEQALLVAVLSDIAGGTLDLDAAAA